MNHTNNNPFDALVELLGRLPGIGARSAQRLAFHILEQPEHYGQALGHAITTIHARVHRCIQCGNYDGDTTCHICKDVKRDSKLLCVVARVQDLHAIEKSSTYRGLYYVLHGLLAPLDGKGPEKLPIKALLGQIEARAITEVIIATPLSVEGESTALYLAKVLANLGINASRIASGMPHGGELEFTDSITLHNAFERRQMIANDIGTL